MAKKDGAKAPEARIDTEQQLDEALRVLEEQAKADAQAAGAEGTEPATSIPASAPEHSSEDSKPKQDSKQASGLREAASRLIDWADAIVPGNRNAAIGALVGLIAAFFLFVLGIWRTLVIALLVVCGIAVGQVFDGDPKIIRTLRALFDRSRDR